MIKGIGKLAARLRARFWPAKRFREQKRRTEAKQMFAVFAKEIIPNAEWLLRPVTRASVTVEGHIPAEKELRQIQQSLLRMGRVKSTIAANRLVLEEIARALARIDSRLQAMEMRDAESKQIIAMGESLHNSLDAIAREAKKQLGV